MGVATAGPRPGEPCVLCHKPIAMNDKWYGGKGDYWHLLCYQQNMEDTLNDKYHKADEWKRRISYNQYGEYEYEDNAYEDQHADGYQMGYNVGYEHGERDGKMKVDGALNEMVDQIRGILDRHNVPVMVDSHYGVGQAARIAWFMERNGYVIQELGNPDALKER